MQTYCVIYTQSIHMKINPQVYLLSTRCNVGSLGLVSKPLTIRQTWCYYQ